MLVDATQCYALDGDITPRVVDGIDAAGANSLHVFMAKRVIEFTIFNKNMRFSALVCRCYVCVDSHVAKAAAAFVSTSQKL